MVTTMHTLYDSAFFSVTHMTALADEATAGQAARAEDEDAVVQPVLLRHGFEIVDKRHGKEVYLDGSWAELFQQRIVEWQRNTPTEEEVEDTLAQFAELAQTPVGIH